MERPILFNDEMVRAILDGQKTQTRRVVKPQYVDTKWKVNPAQDPRFERHSHDWWLPDTSIPSGPLPKCPYGQPGDRLWVRETWSVNFYGGHSGGGEVYQHFGIEYRAGGDAMDIEIDHHDEALTRLFDTQRGDWRPSIHMPRWASRILLEVVSVRVERLQEICADDCEAEGVDNKVCQQFLCSESTRGQLLPAVIHGFSGLWESINGVGSWDDNPWVWVVEFKRIDGGEVAA